MKITGSILWLIAQIAAVLTIEFVGLAVLSRLVAPDEFGVFAPVIAVILLAQFLGQFGTQTLILRAETLSRQLFCEVAGLVLVATALIVAILYLFGVALDLFFADPRSTNLFAALIIFVPVASFGGSLRPCWRGSFGFAASSKLGLQQRSFFSHLLLCWLGLARGRQHFQ